MFCTKCGAKRTENARFCIQCGAIFKDADTELANEPQKIENTNTPPKTEPPPPANPPAGNLPHESIPPPPTKNEGKKGKRKTWIPIVAGIVVLALAGGALWLFTDILPWSYSDGSSSTQNQDIETNQDNRQNDSPAQSDRDSGEDPDNETQSEPQPNPQAPTPQPEPEENDSTAISNEDELPPSRLTMQISQIDNSSFPEVALYSRIQDEEGNDVTGVDKQYFTVKEFGTDGREYTALITDILPVSQSETMSINLVIDRSGSMSEENRMQNAKNAAGQFVDEILRNRSNSVELTSFDSYVYTTQQFTNDANALQSAINSIFPGGQTALFDALYDALISTSIKSGSRFVIAFTDGEENASLHREQDVIELSRMTGIPVYLIGIGSDTNDVALRNLAKACNGEYYHVDGANLQNLLLQIYEEVYEIQRNMYKVSYTSTYAEDLRNYRTVKIEATGDFFEGSAELEYMPRNPIVRIDNARLTSIITSYNTIENVAVAIVDLNTDLEYRVGSARTTFVASGFYAPVYIVAHDTNPARANLMMENMDNNAGNQLIRDFGGLSSITDALANAGYTQTTFSRNFGDVAASNRGLENYTSALDSAKILREIYNIGGYTRMNWDLTRDGISVPTGVTIHSHRGQGIGGAYNAFAIIISGDVKYGIAIMTMHPGRNNEQARAIAVPMISEILDEVHSVMMDSI